MSRFRLLLLLPHALSLLCFGAAFAAMQAAGTNRSALDLNLGIAGFSAGAAAPVATLIALWRPPRWRALSWHLPALAFVAAAALSCFAAHLA